MMAGAGFDAAVVEGVTPAAKRRLGKGAYVAETLRLAMTGAFPDLAVEVDGRPFAAKSVVVCNGRRYGGAYVLPPAADISHPGFQVILLKGAGGWRTLTQGLNLMLGRLARDSGTQVLSADRVVIAAPPPGTAAPGGRRFLGPTAGDDRNRRRPPDPDDPRRQPLSASRPCAAGRRGVSLERFETV